MFQWLMAPTLARTGNDHPERLISLFQTTGGML